MTINDIYELAKKSQEKFKHKYRERTERKDQLITYYVDQPILSINWYFYKKHLIKKDATRLYEKVENIIGDYELMGRFSDTIKKLGPTIENWNLYVDINTLFGWKEQPQGQPIWDKVMEWMANKDRPSYMGSEERFLEKFREKVRIVLRSGSKKAIPMDTPPEDIMNNIPYMGTTGGAFDTEKKHKMKYEMDDIDIKIKRNKYTANMSYPLKEKVENLTKKRKAKARVSVKMEFYPKVRTIINGDMWTTNMHRFMDVWLEPFLAGSPLSTLWQTSEQAIDMWEQMISQVGRNWSVPIDQKRFDHRFTKLMYLIIHDEEKNLMIEYGNGKYKPFWLEVNDAARYALENMIIIYKHKLQNWKTPWESGIASGLQTTAKYDTIANAAEIMMAEEICNKEYRINVEKQLFNAQGDDDLLNYKTLQECLALWAAMSSMTFEVHLSKNFFSKQHNEYLRKYSVENKLNGYPARMVNNLLWIYPGDTELKDQRAKITSMKDNWLKFSNRLGSDWNYIKSYFMRDATGAKMPILLLKELLSIHRINGGLGMQGERLDKMVSNIPGEYKKKLTMEDAQGFNDFNGQFGKDQEREVKDWAAKVAGVPNLYKGIVIKEEDTLVIQDVDEITELPFTIMPNTIVKRPEYKDGWNSSLIFSTRSEVMAKAFSNIDVFYQNNAPKSWINDFATGKLDFVTPPIAGKSDEFAALYWKKFNSSILYAMMKKKTRNENKWRRLQLYAYNHFEELIRGHQDWNIANFEMY